MKKVGLKGGVYAMSLGMHMDALLGALRATIQDEKIVVIFGWKDSNHNEFTRKLPANKVRFFHRIPNPLPLRTGIVLATRFISHSERERVISVSNGLFRPTPLGIGQIRALLIRCKPLLSDDRKKETGVPVTVKTDDKTTPPKEAVVRSTTPHNDGELCSSEKRLARAFLKATYGDSNRTLSKYEISALIHEVYGSGHLTSKFVKQGYFLPVISDGRKKAGSYAASPQLLALITQSEPNDPVARAQFLVSKKDEFERLKAELNNKLSEVERKLRLIAGAEELLKKLDDLLK